MKLTDEDLIILLRFKFAPYDSEHMQPSYLNKNKDFSIQRCLINCKQVGEGVYTSMRKYYALK